MERDQHDEVMQVNESTMTGQDNTTLNFPMLNVHSESNLDEVVRNLQNANCVYRQDVVRSKSSGMFGIVTEVPGDSDSESESSITDDEDEDDEDDNDGDGFREEGGNHDNDNANGSDNNRSGGSWNSNSLPPDQIRVLWMDQSETTQNLCEVMVVDRGFLHGDFVAAASDPTGQVGVVVDVHISVDLLTTDGSIIKGVSSRDLKRVRDFAVGDNVVLGPWLGRIDDVLDNVTVLFDDGSVCKVVKADPLRLKPVGKQTLEDGHFPYYPGQRVKATSSSVFKNSRWLSGLWKPNRLEGTVTKVTVGSVFIYWIASAGYGPDSSTTPAEEQSPKNLKILSCFEHANWQLGDWSLLHTPAMSSLLEKNLSNLELHDSTKGELESAQMGHECESDMVVSEESNGVSETVDMDVDGPSERTSGNVDGNSSRASSSCSSSLSVSKEPVHETWPLHRKKIRKVVVRKDRKARKKEETFERALLIVNTKTSVDVAWQDGTRECQLDSTTLIPVDSPGDHEFFAEQYVVEKATDDNNDGCEVRRVGVVKSVNGKERTACVRWLKPVARAEDPREFEEEEVVSVYELEGHPDYDYCYGDVVVRLSPVTITSNMSIGDSVEEEKQLACPNPVKRDSKKRSGSKKLESSSTKEACANFSDLSWVGNITGLQNGDIEVTWADGMVSMVGPQAIYVVGRDDDESIAAGSEVSDDAVSWETVDDGEMDALENADEENGLENVEDISPKSEESTMIGENSGSNGPLSLPLAALGFVTRLATGIFSRGKKQTDVFYLDSVEENDLQSQGTDNSAFRSDPFEQSSSLTYNPGDNSGVQTAHGKGDEGVDTKDLLEAAEALCSLKPETQHGSSQNEDDIPSFKGFDIAKDPSDHYFLGANGQNNAGRKWLKKVQQDWSILQNNLPEGIYVRVYEDRMDLLRAVIVGAYGTPYQDGLFFFDFHLPPEYPDVPPSAYYHSGGWRINPNLYEEGKVCLSLLNTWTGKGNEVWDPSSSSILQVLVSLQGLVLNSNPYFNEAGYDKQVGTAEGEKNSLSYNENTFLLNCKTMMYLMRKPPKDFEELVEDHFRMRGYYILKACDAYMKGYLIGSLTNDASLSEKSSANANSVGFKLMLSKILPKLFLALDEVGAGCNAFKHLQQS
ncbi:probable ubiquitin-conjugating enzyme E2 23 [Diospyros lotus]|uniref:probable ubiquitin-conjugating enzyme E2 23 n=1 Tax=Diospyros lotus TaxID=55363 RepID=UPI0022542680|nr:probable ubiquitin-conjugating enzyme E2 23 [Diospyros lotus]XP_052182197.1 probable ubiquitin-conjugating enzyme E2 23 [Diospyros lotus]XP_052182198.1 probable ubiquitin-conjugating enzyme E2 23 [Diospyros lotus]